MDLQKVNIIPVTFDLLTMLSKL